MSGRRFAGQSRLAAALTLGALLSASACTFGDTFRLAKVVNDCQMPIQVVFFPGPAKPGGANNRPPGGLGGGPPVAPGASFPGYYDPVVDPAAFTLFVRSAPGVKWKVELIPYDSLPKARGGGYSVIVRISGSLCRNLDANL